MPVLCLSGGNTSIFYQYLLDAGQFANNLEYEKAELYYQKAVHYCDSTNIYACEIETSKPLIELWLQMAKYAEAESLLSQNLRIGKNKVRRSHADSQNLQFLSALLQFKLGHYKKTLQIIDDKLLPIATNNSTDSLQLSRVYELIGKAKMELADYEGAFERFNAAYQMHPKKNLKAAVANYHFNIGLYFYQIKEFDNAEAELRKSGLLWLDVLLPNHPSITNYQFWQGKIHLKKREFKQADSLFTASLSNRKNLFKTERHPSIAESYYGVAQMHQQQANYTGALQYYQLCINVLKKAYPQQHPQLAKAYNNLASIQQLTNDYQNASKNYNSALRIFENFFGKQHAYYLNGLNNLGLLNMNAGKLKTALNNFEEAIAQAESSAAKRALLDRLYFNIAILYVYLNNDIQMNDYLLQIENFTPGQLIELAKILFKKEKYDRALFYLNDAEEKDGKKSFLNQADLYYWQAKLNYARHKDSQTIQSKDSLHIQNEDRLYIYNAQNAIQNCNLLIQQRRKEVGELLRFNEKIRPAYELGLQIFYEGYQATKNSTFIDDAFQFIHTSKAHVLLNRLNENKAIQLGLTTKLIKKENAYRRKINGLKQAQYEGILNEDSIGQLLNKVQNEYKNFKNKLEREHPQYYKLKYGTAVVNIKKVQSNLDKQTSVIEYFLSDKSLYILQIEKNDKRFFKINKPPDLLDDINAFRQTINWGMADSIATAQIYTTFVQHATSLYQAVLAPPLQAIAAKGIQQLIIIPDNQLNYLPFDMLLSDSLTLNSQTQNNFKMLPYVLNKYAIGYAYSSSFLTNQFKQSQHQHQLNYIGYAPAYKNVAKQLVDSLTKLNKPVIRLRGGYSNLPSSIKVVLKLDSIFNGISYTDGEASKDKFLENVNKAKIQHLAMHGEVNDQNPQLSKLIFADENLTMGDLNALQINADLVVLSACNTGTGQLKNGEGVLSLSRAFAYAGCPSVVMSLWSLPDEQTAAISELFFINLKNGQSKSVALQQAKLSFLQNVNNDRVAHPIYWGGLVATGNMAPIFEAPQNKLSGYCYAWLLLILVLLIIGCSIKLHKKA